MRSRGTGSWASPMFQPLSAARAIATMTGCRCFITRPASTGFAPNLTLPDRRIVAHNLCARRWRGAPAEGTLHRNHPAGRVRPFIEHQLEIGDFCVKLQTATPKCDVALIYFEEILAAFPEATIADKNSVTVKVELSEKVACRSSA